MLASGHALRASTDTCSVCTPAWQTSEVSSSVRKRKYTQKHLRLHGIFMNLPLECELISGLVLTLCPTLHLHEQLGVSVLPQIDLPSMLVLHPVHLFQQHVVEAILFSPVEVHGVHERLSALLGRLLGMQLLAKVLHFAPVRAPQLGELTPPKEIFFNKLP